jgi:hypothetical protein
MTPGEQPKMFITELFKKVKRENPKYLASRRLFKYILTISSGCSLNTLRSTPSCKLFQKNPDSVYENQPPKVERAMK